METVSLELPLPASVRVPERSFRNDLRAIKIVWQRELIRFVNDRTRMIGALTQPILYLFVLGTGLSAMLPSKGVMNFRVFLFPGVMVMATLFTCFFSAGSLVWDREFGFMREMLVAPIRRGSIVIGKCLGGATAGTFQGLILLILGAAVGVPYDLRLVLTLVGELMLISFAVTALGVLIASRLTNMQGFMALVQMVLMPLFFMSGALFPLRGLPLWLEVVTRLDPLTYAVDPMRRAVLERVGVDLPPSVTWGSWPVPVSVELGLVAGFAVVALWAAIGQFSRSE